MFYGLKTKTQIHSFIQLIPSANLLSNTLWDTYVSRYSSKQTRKKNEPYKYLRKNSILITFLKQG